MKKGQLQINNPFPVIAFIGEEYYCNRKNELAILQEHIENERNVVMYSWRRLGKTALVRCLFSRLEKQKNAETVFVDLMAVEDMDAAVARIATAIFNRFGTAKKGFSETMLQFIGRLGLQLSFDPNTGAPELNIGMLNTTENHAKSLRYIGEFLMQRNTRIVLALDEFQDITAFETGEAEAMFRSFAQEFPHIRLIFSGSHREMMTSMFTDKNRPFYRSAQLLEINPIALEHYQPFIKKQFTKYGKSIDDAIIHQLYLWSKGQTYAVQLICNKLFSISDNPTQEQLQKVCSEIIQQEAPIFHTFTSTLTKVQRKILKAIAIEQQVSQPKSSGFLNKYKLGAASTVQDALKRLLEMNIVVYENENYFVQDIILSRWLESIR
jgi:uncharacterized protein